MNKTNKKQVILKSAENLFEQYGYKKVSIDEIVQKASIAKGTFYLYFKNKNEVYNEIFENFYKKLEQPVEEWINKKIDIRTKLYIDFIGGLYFLSEKKILYEIFLNNPNYISESVTFERLLNINTEMSRIFFKNDLEKIRNDIEFSELIQAYSSAFKILHFQKEMNKKSFWKLAENLARIFIDGLFSKEKWKPPPTEGIIKMTKKEFL